MACQDQAVFWQPVALVMRLGCPQWAKIIAEPGHPLGRLLAPLAQQVPLAPVQVCWALPMACSVSVAVPLSVQE